MVSKAIEVVPEVLEEEEVLEDTEEDPEAPEAKEEAIQGEEVDPEALIDREAIDAVRTNARGREAILEDGKMTLKKIARLLKR